MVYLLILAIIWLIVELFVISRDRIEGKGKTDKDKGTRTLNILSIIVGMLISIILFYYTNLSFWGKRSDVFLRAGIIVISAGIVVRAWAVISLGNAFRSTIETHEGQSVVEDGVYKFIRHPSYSGAVLACLGYGIAFQNWISLLLLLIMPVIAFNHRITHEEAELIRVFGQDYINYQKKTKKLIPFIW
jgi:protein-S-isoprenylcysteine O-methyltransferase Ste14